jgi:transcriptional regulator with XRE-family HTH domain
MISYFCVDKYSKMKEKLADRIILLRKQAGLTQVELADKIGVSKSQYIRYETKDVQPPANIMNKLADALATSVDYLISGDKSEKAKASLKNSELIQRFKEVDALPEEEQGVLIKIISAYVRDYRAKQAYAS